MSLEPASQPPAHWLAKSETIFTAAEVNLAVQGLARQIEAGLGSDEPLLIMCVMRGGLYLTGLLMANLRVPAMIDYLQANRYHGLSGSQIVWSKYPEIDLQGRRVLIVDDILDAGVTLAEVVRYCRDAGATTVHTAVLTEKDNGIQKPLKADFVALQVPDRYVFGCGMDVYGWWRNLSEIRALRS